MGRDQARARGLEEGIRSQDGTLRIPGQLRSLSLKLLWKHTGTAEGRGSRVLWNSKKKYDHKGGMTIERDRLGGWVTGTDSRTSSRSVHALVAGHVGGSNRHYCTWHVHRVLSMQSTTGSALTFAFKSRR